MKYAILLVVAIAVVAAAPPEARDSKPLSKAACKDKVEGGDCDPFDNNCDQCDWCYEKVSFYFRCHQTRSLNPFVPSSGTWVKEQCAPGYLVDKTKPLASGAKGGQCTAWDDLDSDVQKDYFDVEECKLPEDLCEYGQDDDCTANYWFLPAGAGSVKEPRTCQGTGDIFDVDTENCKPCSAVSRCAGKGSC